MSNFHPLQAVHRDSEAQIQVGKIFIYTALCIQRSFKTNGMSLKLINQPVSGR